MFTKFRMNLDKKGFTLIELLIVVAIIGILAAIAIPQFGAYRRRGYNAAANSDLRTIRTTQEAMQSDFQDYGASSAVSSTGAGTGGAFASATVYLVGGRTTTSTQSISLSPNVIAGVESATNAAGQPRTDYVAITAHSAGDNYYGVDSDSTKLYRKGFAVGTLPATLQTNVVGMTPTAGTDNLGADTTWVQMQ